MDERGDVVPEVGVAGAGTINDWEIEGDEVLGELHGVEVVGISCVYCLHSSFSFLELDSKRGLEFTRALQSVSHIAHGSGEGSTGRRFGLPVKVAAPATVGTGGSPGRGH